jgi:hypothetical protein
VAADRWWLGWEFEGLPLTYSDQGHFVYGDCDPGPGEGGCAPPLEVQNRSACDRNPVAIDIAPRVLHRLRGGGVVALYGGAAADVMTGRSSITIYAYTKAQVKRAVIALRRRREHTPRRMAPPHLPLPVLMELKRVVAAADGEKSVRGISRNTGVARAQVRGRLRLARLLGKRALRDVAVPTLPWRTIKKYRQAAFSAEAIGEAETARNYGVSRPELRRMIRRVPGLAGGC